MPTSLKNLVRTFFASRSQYDRYHYASNSFVTISAARAVNYGSASSKLQVQLIDPNSSSTLD